MIRAVEAFVVTQLYSFRHIFVICTFSETYLIFHTQICLKLKYLSNSKRFNDCILRYPFRSLYHHILHYTQFFGIYSQMFESYP